MNDSAHDATQDVIAPDDAYIRGSGAVFDQRLTLRITSICSAVIMVTLALILIVQASGENSRIDRLRSHGVAVDVTVTGCVALASGTGITEAGYRCQGTFTLDTRDYQEIIGGTRTQYPVGQQLSAVVDPGDPANLYPRALLADRRPSVGGYVLPGALLLVVLVGGALRWRRRRRQPSGRDGGGAQPA